MFRLVATYPQPTIDVVVTEPGAGGLTRRLIRCEGMIDVQPDSAGEPLEGTLSLWVPDGPSVPPAAVQEVPVVAVATPVGLIPVDQAGRVTIRSTGARYEEDPQAFPRVNLVLDVGLACAGLAPATTIRLAYHVTAVVLPLA